MKMIGILAAALIAAAGSAYAGVPDVGAAFGAETGKTSMEASREFSGKPFLEMQHKAPDVKLDFMIQPVESAPLKLSSPAKRSSLKSAVKGLPDNTADLEQLAREMQKERYELLDTAMTLTITGIGVVFGGLAFGVPGAVIGGAFTYGAWTAAKKTS